MIRHLLAISLSAFSLTASALTDAWTVDVTQHTAVQRTYKQGESVAFSITLKDGLKSLVTTNASAVFYWYTNATANLWWTNAASVTSSGVVSSTWTPAMDTGAATYPYWVGLWTAGATTPVWRVSGTIRLLTSPGVTPNSLPLPVRTLDFAGITVTNAPWLSIADFIAASNALASAIQTGGTGVTNHVEAVEFAPGRFRLYRVTN